MGSRIKIISAITLLFTATSCYSTTYLQTSDELYGGSVYSRSITSSDNSSSHVSQQQTSRAAQNSARELEEISAIVEEDYYPGMFEQDFVMTEESGSEQYANEANTKNSGSNTNVNIVVSPSWYGVGWSVGYSPSWYYSAIASPWYSPWYDPWYYRPYSWYNPWYSPWYSSWYNPWCSLVWSWLV